MGLIYKALVKRSGIVQEARATRLHTTATGARISNAY